MFLVALMLFTEDWYSMDLKRWSGFWTIPGDTLSRRGSWILLLNSELTHLVLFLWFSIKEGTSLWLNWALDFFRGQNVNLDDVMKWGDIGCRKLFFESSSLVFVIVSVAGALRRFLFLTIAAGLIFSRLFIKIFVPESSDSFLSFGNYSWWDAPEIFRSLEWVELVPIAAAGGGRSITEDDDEDSFRAYLKVTSGLLVSSGVSLSTCFGVAPILVGIKAKP